MHWRKFAALKKRQKRAVYLLIPRGFLPTPPLLITITRVGPRKLDDDNLASACKYVRDAIADVVGIDDGSDQYVWRYEQKTRTATCNGRYGVDVEITSR